MTNETPEQQAQTPPPLPPDPPPNAGQPAVGYCRACGVSLYASTVRQAMGTLYCAEHVPASAAASGSVPPPADNPYASPYAMPPRANAVNTDTNPGLAFLLGLIPGVGAIYNGQYAKGLVHVIGFGFLISVAESYTPLANFAGFLAMISVIYMAFEAYHTAKLRATGQMVDEFSSILPADKRSAAFPMVPVVLIGAGIVFLLINFEVLSLRFLMRLWPVGLIVLGAYMLWDRLTSRTLNSGSTPSAGGFPDVQ